MKTRNLIAATLAMFAAFMVANPAFAQTRVLIVDSARVEAESKAGKDVASKLKAIAEQISNELKPTQDALAKEQKSLNDKMAPLNEAAIRSDKALIDRFNSFQKRSQEFAVKQQTRAAELELTRRDAGTKYFQALQPVLKEVIEEKGADVVLERSSVVFAGKAVDITEEVITKLDASTPSVNVTKQKLPKKTGQ